MPGANILYNHGQPTITGEPTMIERSTTSVMAVKTVIMIVQIHNGARREEERVGRRREGGYIEGRLGHSEDTVRVQLGYSEGTGRIQWGTVRAQWGTVRVHWGIVRVQLGYRGIQ